jgi:subtilase family serine protease
MPSDFALHIELVFKLRNPDQLSKCLASVGDPSSPDYGHFLSMTMLQPYLPTPGQKASIVSFLSRMGMSVTSGASPLVLEISAPVRSVEKAFGVRMNVFAKNPKFGFYAADSDPIMPQNFASIVGGILGLENYTRPMPLEYPCSGPYCPQGIQVGYSLSSLYGNGYDGTGQEVAIVDAPGDPNIQTTINTYSTQYGLPSTTLDIRYPDGLPSSYDSGWAVETALDVEAVHAVAPKATILLLYDQNPMNAIDYVATNHLATIVSNSWTYACGPSSPCSDTQLSSSFVSSVHNQLALYAAQGLTLLFASGDDGATPDGTNWGTEFPASDPNVLAVGGTDLALSGCGYYTCSGYFSETGASISGGGYSGYFAEPSWQTSSIGARPGRAVPDVSILGQNPHYWTYLTGSGWLEVYGTSLSTPLWAGFLAIALQMKGSSSFGNLGPTLYQIASSPAY